MVRRKKVKRKRPVFGIPKGIVLLATPEGWRTSDRGEMGSAPGALVMDRPDHPHRRDAPAPPDTED
ncbi:hypothetical protein [Streptomyces sp. NPDC090131]|uniref:hypothetical protein n=1 Tax=Streptomyces sp. NPDC090131 TaxID=3365954 RepID=UPI003830A310